MTKNKRIWLYAAMCVIAAAAVILDQWLKAWTTDNMQLSEQQVLIPRFLGLYHVQNTGASFSLFSNTGWFLPVLSGLALLLILFVIIRQWITHPVALIALSMIFGGALGNMIDRVRLRYVVDMLEFLFVRFAIFNIADVFVIGGGILFCVYFLFLQRKLSKTAREVPPAVGDKP